jgi:hypothetical protein
MCTTVYALLLLLCILFKVGWVSASSKYALIYVARKVAFSASLDIVSIDYGVVSKDKVQV